MPVSKNWLNLRSFLRKSYNREVNAWFADLDNEVPGNSTARQQAKRACLILPKESQNMASIKMEVFRYVVQRTHLKPDIYGTPIGNMDAQRKYRPQIVLFFKQDLEESNLNKSPVQAQISYRLMNKTSETITTALLTSIAKKIKDEFGGTTEFIWRRGKDLATYTDKANGYQFTLLVRNKTDAKNIISKVLNTNSDIPKWEHLRYQEADVPNEAFPASRGRMTILNQVIEEPVRRPISNVRFQYAYCSLWGKGKPVTLYDKSFRYFDALVS